MPKPKRPYIRGPYKWAQVYKKSPAAANCGCPKKSSRGGGGYRGEERLQDPTLTTAAPLLLHGGNGCQMSPHLGGNTRSGTVLSAFAVALHPRSFVFLDLDEL